MNIYEGRVIKYLLLICLSVVSIILVFNYVTVRRLKLSSSSVYTHLVTTVTPTPGISPTTRPSPIITANQVPSPTFFVQSESLLLDRINEYRTDKGLYMLKSDSQTCEFAHKRAAEIQTNFSHLGFQERLNSNGLPYSTYSTVTENIAFTDISALTAFQIWIDSPSHRENLEKDTPYACVARLGNYYVYEGWKP